MQPLTFLISVFFLHATQLEAIPADEPDTDPSRRSLQFNVNIKNYPETTTTTEESLLDYISGSVSDTISSLYDKVKNVVTGPEEKEEKIRIVYPAAKLRRQQRRYPIPYTLSPPALLDQRAPIPVLNTPVSGYVPNYVWNKQISNTGIAEEKSPTGVQYFVNKFGQLIAKEVPIKSDKKEEQSGEKPIGNYFNIEVNGRVQNSSALLQYTPVLYGGATLNSGRQQLNRNLKNLVSDIISVQNIHENS